MKNVENQTLILHDLLAVGADDDQLEATLSELDKTWQQLSESERSLYADLLHDLKMLRADEVPQESPALHDEDSLLLREAKQHVDAQDWHGALELLRGAIDPRFIAEIADLRFRAWRGLGFQAVAKRFSQFSTSLKAQRYTSPQSRH